MVNGAIQNISKGRQNGFPEYSPQSIAGKFGNFDTRIGGKGKFNDDVALVLGQIFPVGIREKENHDRSR